MNKKSQSIFFIFLFLLSLLVVEVVYLKMYQTLSADVLEKKVNFVSLTGLPDLALSNENTYIRHRSLTNVFAIYNDDSSLREYDLVSFSTNNFKGIK